MVGTLLLRGMLVGIVAGLFCFAFLRIVGEPQVDRAIAFESQMNESKGKAAAPMDMSGAKPGSAMNMGTAGAAPEPEEELVSRPTQAGIGLFTGVAVYGAAFGGLFALAYAIVFGRIGALDPRATSALLAGMGFLSLHLIPCLKYPANPPSVGEPETIGIRTACYFAMIAISLAGMIGSGMLRQHLLRRFGGWNATLIAAAIYVVIVSAATFALPVVNEVPEQFPAVVLWQFRIASLGAQLLMWSVIGLLFGALTERAARSSPKLSLRASTP